MSSSEPDRFSSNAIRLSPREWAAAIVCILAVAWLAPWAWQWAEPVQSEPDDRIAFGLGNDYWMYERLAHRACREDEILVVGDSVVWGHYVPAEDALPSQLNKLPLSRHFANLGVDGTHPVAMAGLLQYYGREIAGRTVVLHCNLLWMSSLDADLQGERRRSINHPALLPQFSPRVASYRETWRGKVGNVLARYLPFLPWTNHLQLAYFEQKDLASWMIEHPYECPVAKMRIERSSPDERSGVESSGPGTALAFEPAKTDFEWVPLADSLQWRFFRQTVETLKGRGNRVFVVVGPFNEYMLTPASRRLYAERLHEVAVWLSDQGIAHHIAPLLPPEEYADASHPLGVGYQRMADSLVRDPAFREVF